VKPLLTADRTGKFGYPLFAGLVQGDVLLGQLYHTHMGVGSPQAPVKRLLVAVYCA